MEGNVNQCPQAAPGRAAKDWLGHVRVVKEAPRVRRETKYREGVSASYKKSNSNEGYCYEWNYLFSIRYGNRPQGEWQYFPVNVKKWRVMLEL